MWTFSGCLRESGSHQRTEENNCWSSLKRYSRKIITTYFHYKIKKKRKRKRFLFRFEGSDSNPMKIREASRLCWVPWSAKLTTKRLTTNRWNTAIFRCTQAVWSNRNASSFSLSRLAKSQTYFTNFSHWIWCRYCRILLRRSSVWPMRQDLKDSLSWNRYSTNKNCRKMSWELYEKRNTLIKISERWLRPYFSKRLMTMNNKNWSNRWLCINPKETRCKSQRASPPSLLHNCLRVTVWHLDRIQAPRRCDTVAYRAMAILDGRLCALWTGNSSLLLRLITRSWRQLFMTSFRSKTMV